MEPDKTSKVFISYSWDNEPHKEWVLNLADRLTKNGIYAFFDRYDLRAGKDMNHFMENSVQESNKILLIMTPNYKVKAEKREGGVGYETSMITSEIFNNQQSDKFIPIVKLGKRENCTPIFVKSKINIDMSDDNKFEESFEELLRIIYDKPKIQRPNLGGKPNFNETNISDKENKYKQEVSSNVFKKAKSKQQPTSNALYEIYINTAKNSIYWSEQTQAIDKLIKLFPTERGIIDVLENIAKKSIYWSEQKYAIDKLIELYPKESDIQNILGNIAKNSIYSSEKNYAIEELTKLIHS